jgi:acetyl esterase
MLHPQAAALLKLIEDKGVPPTHTLAPEDARKVYRDRRLFTQPDPPEVAQVRALTADGPAGPIPLRLYRPLGSNMEQKLPVLVFYHGGGWVMGDLETHDTLCRQLANGSGCAVVAVDYRMGPEHRFPGAVDDAIAAAQWVRVNAVSLHLDSSRMAKNLPLSFQLLIYPATDMRRFAPSHSENGEGYLLTKNTISYFHDHYIDDDRHDLDWRASPLLHEDLSLLPPAFVLTAGFDPLRDEGRQYAEKLSEAGTQSTLVCFERQIHGFVLMGRVLDEANAAVTMCATQLRQALLKT